MQFCALKPNVFQVVFSDLLYRIVVIIKCDYKILCSIQSKCLLIGRNYHLIIKINMIKNRWLAVLLFLPPFCCHVF